MYYVNCLLLLTATIFINNVMSKDIHFKETFQSMPKEDRFSEAITNEIYQDEDQLIATGMNKRFARHAEPFAKKGPSKKGKNTRKTNNNKNRKQPKVIRKLKRTIKKNIKRNKSNKKGKH